jgi:hypothetical protein
MKKRTIGHVLLTTALLALTAAPAHAATVEMITKYAGRDGGEDQFQQDVIYRAAEGERNALVMSVDYQRAVLEDHSAEIKAIGGCTNLSPHIAVCDPPDAFGRIEAGLGDGNDTGRIDSSDQYHPVTRLDGGAGDDSLQGGVGTDNLLGGPGDDLVDGGAGGDTINGGGGRDQLRAGAVSDGFDTIEDGETDADATADVIVGNGEGYYQTMVSYRERRQPVTVDLKNGTAGAPGEGDTLVGGLHMVTGGAGDDVLRGTDDDDVILGNDGADRIFGGAGNDSLFGEAGADRVSAGSGNDTLDRESDDAVDGLDCGRGADWVGATDARDRLLDDCEEVAWSASSQVQGDPFGNRITTQPALRGGRATFRSTCSAEPECTGRIELRTPTGRKLLGVGRFSLEANRAESPDKQPREAIRVRLTERGIAHLRRGGYVRVVIAAQYDCGGCLNPPKPVKNGFTTYMSR